VVLEAGFGGNGAVWQLVQPALGRTTRTCAYDRAGIGSSVAPPGVSDAQLENDDLRRLLEHLRAEPPYVLVGHSYGGLLVRLFAHTHPDETAGIVLVDSMGRDQTRRQMAIWPKSVAPGLRRELAAPVRENVNLAAGEAFAARIRSLGDLPLVVITANDDFADVPRRLARALKRQWFEMQDELAALSDDHLHVVALRSDHFVMQAERQPDVIIRAIRAAVRAVRGNSRLPACRSVFRGAGVRCRADASG
jgi:pimeloyl-ACP methyl ester carboxylesterase